jgi:C-terminal processing protease CtpA/Prc
MIMIMRRKLTPRRVAGLALVLGASALFPPNQAPAQDEPATKPAETPRKATPTPAHDTLFQYIPVQNQVGVQPYIDTAEQTLAPYYYALTAAPDDPASAANANQFWIAAFHDPADATLGATLEPLGDAVRAQLGLEDKTGLLVADLANDGPAAGAGLHCNDILLSLADVPLGAAGDLPKQLKAAGDKEKPLTLKLIREGKPMTLRVRPVTRVTLGPAEPEKTSYYIGVSASPVDDVLRLHVQVPPDGHALPAGQGLLVTEVVAGSPAEKAGVKQYDVLLTLKDKPLDRAETLAAQVQAVGAKPATLTLIRAGKPLSLGVTPEPRKVEADFWQAAKNVRFWNYQHGSAQPRQFTFQPTWTGEKPEVMSEYLAADRVHATAVDRLAKARLSHNAPTAAPDSTAKRLDALDKEIKALRKAIEEMRDTLKKER